MREVVLGRIYSLDYLKLVLAVLVAFGHTSWLQSHPTPLAAMLGNGLMRTIVPLFCIVSGYFFYRAVARGDGMKWLRRVLVLYLVWMAVYLPFWLGQVHGLLSHLAPPSEHRGKGGNEWVFGSCFDAENNCRCPSCKDHCILLT